MANRLAEYLQPLSDVLRAKDVACKSFMSLNQICVLSYSALLMKLDKLLKKLSA